MLARPELCSEDSLLYFTSVQQISPSINDTVDNFRACHLKFAQHAYEILLLELDVNFRSYLIIQSVTERETIQTYAMAKILPVWPSIQQLQIIIHTPFPI